MDPTPLLDNEKAQPSEIVPGGAAACSAQSALEGEIEEKSAGCSWPLAGLMLGMVLLLMVLVLPAFALGLTDNGWLVNEGGIVSVGWKGVKGYKPCEFRSQDVSVTVWEACTEEELKSDGGCVTDLKKAGEGWGDAGVLGAVLPVMFLLAVTSPLWLFLCIPIGCRFAFEAKCGKDVKKNLWTDACGSSIWLMTGAIWTGMGMGIIAATIQFVKAAKTGIKHLAQTSVDVICDGSPECSAIRSTSLCAACDFNKDSITCTSRDTCSLQVVKEDCGNLCTHIGSGWGAWISLGTAVLLILVGLGLCLGFVLTLGKTPSDKKSENDEEG